MRSFGVVTLVRLVMEKRILSPARARTVGPGTESPSVHAAYLIPGARSISRFDASRRTSFTGLGSSGSSVASKLRLLPVAYGPERSSSTTTAGADSATAGLELVGIVASHAASAARNGNGAASKHKRPTSDVLVIFSRRGKNEIGRGARNCRASKREACRFSGLAARSSSSWAHRRAPICRLRPTRRVTKGTKELITRQTRLSRISDNPRRGYLDPRALGGAARPRDRVQGCAAEIPLAAHGSGIPRVRVAGSRYRHRPVRPDRVPGEPSRGHPLPGPPASLGAALLVDTRRDPARAARLASALRHHRDGPRAARRGRRDHQLRHHDPRALLRLARGDG